MDGVFEQTSVVLHGQAERQFVGKPEKNSAKVMCTRPTAVDNCVLDCHDPTYPNRELLLASTGVTHPCTLEPISHSCSLEQGPVLQYPLLTYSSYLLYVQRLLQYCFVFVCSVRGHTVPGKSRRVCINGTLQSSGKF